MSGAADASRRLQRAVSTSARRAGVTLSIVEADWSPWASVTFVGARHTMRVTVDEGDQGLAWLGQLPKEEFAIGRHLVADLVVSEGRSEPTGCSVVIEALTVES